MVRRNSYLDNLPKGQAGTKALWPLASPRINRTLGPLARNTQTLENPPGILRHLTHQVLRDGTSQKELPKVTS